MLPLSSSYFNTIIKGQIQTALSGGFNQCCVYTHVSNDTNLSTKTPEQVKVRLKIKNHLFLFSSSSSIVITVIIVVVVIINLHFLNVLSFRYKILHKLSWFASFFL